MNNSYLVARDKKSDEIKVFLLDEKWYLGKYGAGVYLNNSLEAIDMVTSKYSDFKEMNEVLFGLEVENYNNIDVFVVSFNNNKAFFDEVIFNPTRTSNYRTELLNRVALANMAGERMSCFSSLQKIVNDFLLTIYSARDFYSMVVSGDISICPSIVDVCKKIVELDDFDGNFLAGDNFYNNYRSIRNMVEALYRLETLASNNKTDREIANQERYLAKNIERDRVVKQIGHAIENPFGDNLVYSLENASLSDKIKDCDSNYNRKMRARSLNHKLRREEEKRKEEKLKSELEVVNSRNSKTECDEISDDISYEISEDTNEVSNEVKRREIYRVLKKLPVNIFLKDRENNKWVINKRIFNCEMSEEDENKFNTLLTGNMPLFFLKYAFARHEYREANAKGFNLLEYEQEVNYNMRAIEKRFKNSNCLSKTYTWCMLYEKYKRMSDFNTMCDESSSERGKVFEKK